MMRKLTKPAAVLAALALAAGLSACGEKRVTSYEQGKYSGAPVAAPWDSPQYGGQAGAMGGGSAGAHAGPERLLAHTSAVGSRPMTNLSWRVGLAAAVLTVAGYAAAQPATPQQQEGARQQVQQNVTQPYNNAPGLA